MVDRRRRAQIGPVVEAADRFRRALGLVSIARMADGSTVQRWEWGTFTTRPVDGDYRYTDWTLERGDVVMRGRWLSCLRDPTTVSVFVSGVERGMALGRPGWGEPEAAPDNVVALVPRG